MALLFSFWQMSGGRWKDTWYRPSTDSQHRCALCHCEWLAQSYTHTLCFKNDWHNAARCVCIVQLLLYYWLDCMWMTWRHLVLPSHDFTDNRLRNDLKTMLLVLDIGLAYKSLHCFKEIWYCVSCFGDTNSEYCIYIHIHSFIDTIQLLKVEIHWAAIAPSQQLIGCARRLGIFEFC